MSTTRLPANARPIWTPADAAKVAEDAKKHKPVRLRDWIWAPALIAVGMLAPGLATAPAAHADINSDAFVMALDAEGITYSTEADVIKAGYAICDYMDTGATAYDATVMVHNNSQLDLHDSGYVVGAATAAFCPEHVHTIGIA